MLPQSALKDMYPVIMTPSLDGKYFHNYVLSVMNLVNQYQRDGLKLQVFLQRGESLITRARNNCVADFLANPDWTHLCWVDSDIGFSIEALNRLLLSDYDVAAGVYPLKYESWPATGLPTGLMKAEFIANYAHYTVNLNDADENGEAHIRVNADGFIEMEDAPTGFMVIKRNVFERMIKAYPELQYTPDDLGKEDLGLHYRFFDCFVDPISKRYLSEDYGFCRLWTGLGGKVYIDAYSNLTHQGSKLYEGPFAQTLVSNLAFAVGAPEGSQMFLHTEEPLQLNPKGPE